MAKKKKPVTPMEPAGILFGGPSQPDLFYNHATSQSTLGRERMTIETVYYSLQYLEILDGKAKIRIKTFIDESKMLTWAALNIENYYSDLVSVNYEPTKHPSTMQENAYYWAEPNEIDGGKTFNVIFQADGYPATEAFGDWLGDFEAADDIAYRISQGEDLF